MRPVCRQYASRATSVHKQHTASQMHQGDIRGPLPTPQTFEKAWSSHPHQGCDGKALLAHAEMGILAPLLQPCKGTRGRSPARPAMSLAARVYAAAHVTYLTCRLSTPGPHRVLHKQPAFFLPICPLRTSGPSTRPCVLLSTFFTPAILVQPMYIPPWEPQKLDPPTPTSMPMQLRLARLPLPLPIMHMRTNRYVNAAEGAL